MNKQIYAQFSCADSAQRAVNQVKQKFPQAKASCLPIAAQNADEQLMLVPPAKFTNGTLGGVVIPAYMTGPNTVASTILNENQETSQMGISNTGSTIQVVADADTCKKAALFLSNCGGTDISVE